MAKLKKSSDGGGKNAPTEKPVPAAPGSCEVQTTTAFKRTVKKLTDDEQENLIQPMLERCGLGPFSRH